MFRSRFLSILLVMAVCTPAVGASADPCSGRNLIDALSPAERAELNRTVRQTPHSEGLLWQAIKGDRRMTLVGTYHFPDSRHQRLLDRVRPIMAAADALYVEAGPVEEARLTKALTEDPSLMVDASGATLPERLSDGEWRQLSQAMSARGTPAVVAAKLRPWYVSMMLGISPCMMTQMRDGVDKGGLDHLLIDSAGDMALPIRALEPWDTVLTVFADLTPAEEVDMIRTSLSTAGHADDYAVTLTDAYFDAAVWEIWEFGRLDAIRNSGLPAAQIDQMTDLAQTRLMDMRNESWIVPLTKGAADAARQGKGIIAGFGALHLPGEQGVLRLLEKDGWQVTRLDG